MIPTADGGRISLDSSVDAYIDATVPNTSTSNIHDDDDSEDEESDETERTGSKKSKTGSGATTSPVESLKDKRMKNATSARRSRLRKQLRLKVMQECLEQLEARNEVLVRRNRELEAEIAMLKQKYGEA